MSEEDDVKAGRQSLEVNEWIILFSFFSVSFDSVRSILVTFKNIFKLYGDDDENERVTAAAADFFMQISLERCQVYTHICCSVAFTICSQQSVRFMALHDITFKVTHTRES